MGYGSSDYNSGYSSGKSAGREEMQAEIRKTERESLGRVLAANPHFRQGVKDAQQRLGRECGYLGSYINAATITVDTGGFLGTGVFAHKADRAQSSQVIDDAEKIIHDKLLSESLALSDDDYAAGGVAFLNVQYGESDGGEKKAAPNDYELGRAAEFAAGLADKDYYAFGYTGRIANVSTTLGNVHSDGDWTKWLIGDGQDNPASSPAQMDKHYRKFLIDAVQDVIPPVLEKVNALLKAGAPPYNPATQEVFSKPGPG